MYCGGAKLRCPLVGLEHHAGDLAGATFAASGVQESFERRVRIAEAVGKGTWTIAGRG
jgi:hypothetical protein